MKVDEVTLQNILKAYGKQMKPGKNKLKVPKEDITDANKTSKKLVSEDLEAINYEKDGKVTINPQKKDALIDFFQ
jgi:hypothetical protein